MSDASTKRMIEMYLEEATAPMYLSGSFQSPPRNFHNTEEVEFDVLRDDEDVAIVIQDLSVGARSNESNRYTNKSFIPPIYDEEGAITAFDMIKRQPGVDPFQDPNFAANAFNEASRVFRKLEKKIRRAVELMSSQVLQEGKLDLKDQAGVSLFEMDFKPKASHFITTGVSWIGGAGDPLNDLDVLAQDVRRDGKRTPDRLTFGRLAFDDFISNAEVQTRLDNRRMVLGEVAPQARGEGATFQGFVWIGHYRFEMWTYDGFFTDPATGLSTPYVTDDFVIMQSTGARMDLTFGAIPQIIRPDSRALAFLPPRISDTGVGVDLTTNAWFTPNNRNLMVSAGTRPLTIPTAIDTYGRIDTRP